MSEKLQSSSFTHAKQTIAGELNKNKEIFQGWGRKSNLTIKPSDFLYPIEEIYPHTKVVLLCRVSTKQQATDGDLFESQCLLEAMSIQYKISPVYVYPHIGSGQGESTWLLRAIEQGKDKGAPAGFAESLDRLTRADDYHVRYNPNALPGPIELCRLKSYIGDFPIYLLKHPDSTTKEIRSHKRKKFPPQEEEPQTWTWVKDEYQDVAKQLRKDGYNNVEIARFISKEIGRTITRQAIQKWFRE